MMKIWIGIQARSTSSRLPNKVMAEIGGKPMLQHVWERCRQASENTAILIPWGDPLESWIKEKEYTYFCGSETDVLSRYVYFAKQFQANAVARVTSDCPLIDSGMMQDMLDDYDGGVLTNVPQWDGLDFEIFDTSALMIADKRATGDEREHVTKWMYKNMYCEQYPIIPVTFENLLPKLSIDTEDDLERVRDFYARMPSPAQQTKGLSKGTVTA